MTLTARPPRHEINTDTPRYWYGECTFESHFFNALSSLLPEGERFLIRAIRHFEPQITEPTLQSEIRGFIAQEGNHSKAHDQHVQELIAQGFSGLTAMNRFFRTVMQAYAQHTPRYSLAIACAVEHVTTSLAHTLTRDEERFFAPMAPEMREFWYWHSIEELEHKAVSYDLYRAIQGDYPLRLVAAVQVMVGFTVDLYVRHCYLLFKDGYLFDRDEWRRGRTFLFGPCGLLRHMIVEMKRYLRRDFDPHDSDDRAVITAYDESTNKTAHASL